MNLLEERVLEKIDFRGMKSFIGELVATASYGGSETNAQRLMAKKMQEVGLGVDTWRIDFNELSKHPSYSASFKRNEGLGVVGVTGKGEKSLILCGHVDTVSPGDVATWSTDPLRVVEKDGKLYGRGVCDMKGGLAAGLFAVKAVIDSGVKLKGRLVFESCIGEEDGGCGALATCLRGYRGEAGIVMEPSETKIAPEVAGAMSFMVTVKGRSAHACVREEGVSAIDKFLLLSNGLKELEAERNKGINDPLYKRYKTPYALSIGTVRGGEWPGTVPEKLFFEARMGVKVGESEDHARAELEEKIAEISGKDDWLSINRPEVEWKGYSFASSRVPMSHPIVSVLGESFRSTTGGEPVYEGMTYASDARLLVDVANTPTIVFGPGDVRSAHRANECVSVEELEITAKTLAITAMRFLGYSK